MIILANYGGTWIVGKKVENTIEDPRIFLMMADRMGIMEIPGRQKEADPLPLGKSLFWHELAKDGIAELYLRQISGIVAPPTPPQNGLVLAKH